MKQLLNRRQVEELVGLSRSTIYAMMKTGDFPRPLVIAKSAVRWKIEHLQAWIEAKKVSGQ